MFIAFLSSVLFPRPACEAQRYLPLILMKNKLATFFRLSSYTVSVGIGIVILIIAIIGVVDPVGTKMADDNDPFGDPGGPWYGLFLILVSMILIAWPFALNFYRSKKQG